MVHPGTPALVPPSFDCAVRSAAWAYGKKLLPERDGFQSLYDALQLGSCKEGNGRRPARQDEWRPPEDPLPNDGHVLLVDSDRGGEDGGCTAAAGSRLTCVSLHAAVSASRALRIERKLPHGTRITIALREGTHHLPATLALTSVDSGLSIRSYPAEAAVISGGVPLGPLTWRRSKRCKGGPLGCWEAAVEAVDAIRGLRLDRHVASEPRRQIRARYPNFDPAADAVIDGVHMVHDGYTGWIRDDSTTWATHGDHHMNGMEGPWPPLTAATSYFINGSHWPQVEWPAHITSRNGTKIDPSTWTGEGDWGAFVIGEGGTCVDREPAAGYWCAPGAPRHISVPNHPVGISPNSKQLPHLPYANPVGAIVHAWRPGHWYTNMFEVGAAARLPNAGEAGDSDEGEGGVRDVGRDGMEFNFSRGGFQGGEGVTEGEAWYIENVLEELDMGREWWYDEHNRTLYYSPNVTAGEGDDAAPPSLGFTATRLERLLTMYGSPSAPVTNVTIDGLTLRDTSYTYMKPHGLPSGGDWALQREGAVSLNGTVGVAIRHCLFEDLDGNAVYIGGRHRQLVIERNEFVRVGDSAIAAWGDTSECLDANCTLSLPRGVRMGPDARSGDVAHGTVVRANLAREIGMWQKQSSLWFQAVASRTSIYGNVFFNGPRAALNFNDGAFGGDEVRVTTIACNHHRV